MQHEMQHDPPPDAAEQLLALTADERRALIRLLRPMIDEARYPFAPSFAPLRSIPDKLDPPAPRPELRPPPKAYDAPSAARRRRR